MGVPIESWPPARRAQLALLLEVASTPKPGNVDRHREYESLRFEHFLAGATGATPGLEAAADPDISIGEAFERAVAGMACQRGGNTQFGALLLVCPLVRAAVGSEEPTRSAVREVVAGTDVEDAVGFYRAFDHVDVAVDDPPAGETDLDVRRGGDAAATLRHRELSLADIMAISSDRDGVAAEWTDGFERSFRAGSLLASRSGPVGSRAGSVFLELLGMEPDTFIMTTHGSTVAERVTARAAALHRTDADRETVERFGDSLVARDINPGTTADIVAAGLFIALSRGLEV